MISLSDLHILTSGITLTPLSPSPSPPSLRLHTFHNLPAPSFSHLLPHLPSLYFLTVWGSYPFPLSFFLLYLSSTHPKLFFLPHLSFSCLHFRTWFSMQPRWSCFLLHLNNFLIKLISSLPTLRLQDSLFPPNQYFSTSYPTLFLPTLPYLFPL